MSRRSILFSCSVAVIVLAACQPVAPPPPPPPPQPVAQYCAPSIPSSPTGYDAAFDALRRTYTEWASADAPIPIALPDGRTLWTFADTWIGKVLPGGAITPTNHLEHNSFVIQTGACFAPQMGGTPLHRTERIADPAPGEWYWPAAGFVAGSTVKLFLWHLRTATPPLHFEIIGIQLATLSLPDLAVQRIDDLPFTPIAGVHYGATISVTGSTVYAYGRAELDGYVARAPVDQLTTPGAWEFWGDEGAGDTWVDDPSLAVPMTFAGTPDLHLFGSGDGPGAPLSVQAYGAGYLGTAMLLDAFADEVSVFTAPAPEGPWTYHGRIHTTPTTTPEGGDISSYGALLPRGLPGVAGPTVLYSTNDFLFNDNDPPPSIPLYGPRFAAPNPGSLPPP